MKTRILTIAILLVTLFGTTKVVNAANTKSAVITTLAGIKNVSKIEVHGNVELYVSDGNTESVKVYNQYYGESALVENHNGVLRIASYKAEKLVVWVTSNNITSISAFDNAEIKSFGNNLSKIEFNVDLHNKAIANLNLDAYSAKITLADQSKANLNGNITEYFLTKDIATTLNSKNLVYTHFTENKISINEADLVIL
jgi:phage gp45-like